MVDALDEYLVQSLTEFDGTPLQSITKEGLKLGDEDKLAKQKEELKPLTDWLAGVYGERVEKVTVSNRIAKSPCVLVSGQYGWSANMERIMKAQTFANADEATWLHSKKTMEVNPRHPIIRELATKVSELSGAEGEEARPAMLVDLANLLYDSALLSSGFQMRDTADFSRRIQRVIATGLSIDPAAEAEPEPEEPEEASAEDDAAAEETVSTPAADEAAEVHDEL
jgi:HSP90 family molecular chaperone